MENLQIIRTAFMALAVLLFISLYFLNAVYFFGFKKPTPKRLANDLLWSGLLATFLGVLAAIIEIILQP